MLLSEPPASQGEIRFALFGIPIRIHPFFWVLSIFMGIQLKSLSLMIAWVLACFVGILVHELGHALVMRFYGFYPHIVLYYMGGLASPGFGAPHPGRNAQILISAAGPGAGFLLAALLCLALHLFGPGYIADFGWPHLVLVAPDGLVFDSKWLTALVYFLLQVCVWWGIMNLLPVLPLDGGQICDEVCNIVRPYDGTRIALWISCVVGVLVAVTAIVQWGSAWIAVLFGLFAFNSFQQLSQGGYRRW